MSSFDKFVKDLEKRQEAIKRHRRQLAERDQEYSTKDKVFYYTERWQNSIKYSPKVKK